MNWLNEIKNKDYFSKEELKELEIILKNYLISPNKENKMKLEYFIGASVETDEI